MQVLLILALLIAGLAVVFALQNTAVVTIAFLVWKTEGSLALVLLIALAVGALTSFLASLPALIRGRWAVALQKKRQVELEASLTDCRQKLTEAEVKLQAPTPARPTEERNVEPPPPLT